MNAFIHPDDKPKVDHMVRNTLEYLVGTGLNPKGHLSISYRILMETVQYIHVNRISRMIKIPGQEPTFNFSVLRHLTCFQLEKPIHFGWIKMALKMKIIKALSGKIGQRLFQTRNGNSASPEIR
jgi:hypothetical protein